MLRSVKVFCFSVNLTSSISNGVLLSLEKKEKSLSNVTQLVVFKIR